MSVVTAAAARSATSVARDYISLLKLRIVALLAHRLEFAGEDGALRVEALLRGGEFGGEGLLFLDPRL